MPLPYILDPGCIALRASEDLLFGALQHAGRLSREDSLAPGTMDMAQAALDPEAEPTWEKLMALEWLLAVISGKHAIATSLEPFADLPVSDMDTAGPTARQLAESGAAVAVIPLASQDGGPAGLAALVVSPARAGLPPDQRHQWQDAEIFLNRQNLRLDALTTIPDAKRGRIEGTSWQLGAALAAYALSQRPESRLTLAADWLPTGSVLSGGHLKSVLEGNKSDLNTPHRRWLIPSEMRIPDALRRSGFAQAATLDNAWNIITHQGTVEESAVSDWPADIATLHSFASGAREPVIAAALLSRCRHLVLWRSDNQEVSIKPADDIRNILKALRPGLTIEEKDIASSSMHMIEIVLEDALKASLRTGQATLFNVTQGNRLMGFAVHTLARRYPSLLLLYRDQDNAGIDFTGIRYDGRDYPVTFTLRALEKEHSGIAWDKLLSRSAPRPQQEWKELLDKIRIKPESAEQERF